MSEKIIEVVQISADTPFMKDIMEGGIADSGIESNGDVYYHYENNNEQETCEQRLARFGFDVEKIKKWQF